MYNMILVMITGKVSLVCVLHFVLWCTTSITTSMPSFCSDTVCFSVLLVKYIIYLPIYVQPVIYLPARYNFVHNGVHVISSTRLDRLPWLSGTWCHVWARAHFKGAA